MLLNLFSPFFRSILGLIYQLCPANRPKRTAKKSLKILQSQVLVQLLRVCLRKLLHGGKSVFVGWIVGADRQCIGEELSVHF